MRSEWKSCKIEDFADVKSGKRLPKGHSLVEFETEYPYIRLVDVSNGLVQHSNMLYLEPTTQEKISRYIVKSGDICLAIVGNTIGMVFKIDHTVDNVNLTENAARLTNFKDNVVSSYIYYFLISAKGHNEILSRKVGSAQGKLPMYNIKSLEVPLPPLPIQKKIAHILSTLDDKIELNRKMNETLEAMAQALFKSWFVDFDPVHLKAKCTSEEELEAGAKELGLAKEVLELFPSAFVESEMGMIPEGWSWQKITEVCSRIGSGGTPKRKEDDNFNGSINWFTTKELKNGFVLHSIETITDKGLNTSSAKLFPINTVVMAIYAAPTVGRLGILTEESTFNQAACGFVADEEQISYEFLFLYLQDRNSYLNNLANGAAQQNLNVGLVKNLNVPIPSKDIMGKFKAIGEHLFSQLRANTVQIDTLQKTRDTLLPKLLSGELDVSEIEYSQEHLSDMDVGDILSKETT